MKKGDFVRISYVGRLESGEIFDLTDAETAKKEGVFDPRITYTDLPVIIGANFMIPGLDEAVEKMNVGEKKEIEIEPEKAFGQRDAKLVRVVPKKVFKDQKFEPSPGMIVDFGGSKGRIQSVDAGRVRVDFNNPLAGKKLKYSVEVKERIDNPKDQVGAIMDFFGAKDVDVRVEGASVSINFRLPQQLKERVSSLVLQHVKGIEKVNFVESYGRKEEKKD